MRVFLDFEFTGLHQNTTPISIGLVSADGREFYAEFTDYDRDQVNDWIEENVIPNTLYLSLPIEKRLDITMPANHYLGDRRYIVQRLSIWIRQFPLVEVWADCLWYDWVLFCELFGGALNLPRNIYYIPFDICTAFRISDIDPDIDREEYARSGTISRDNTCSILGKNVGQHNSLVDARILKSCYDTLKESKWLGT